MQLLNKNKFIPWFLCLLLILQGTGLYHITSVFAGNASTSAGVNNKAPEFSVGPADDSSSASPTDVGVDVTFTATATDKNSNQYYLAVCKDSTAPTPGNDAAPTCNGTGTWCVSTSPVAAGSPTSCTHAAASGDAPSKAWYAFVCDKLPTGSGPLCSAYSQGSGEPGVSPFYVNTQPDFTVFADDAGTGVNPGTTVVWTSTASDADGDLIALYVCKTQAFSGGACTVAEWCHDATPQASNPTCTNSSMPSIMQDGDNAAYGYIIDARGSVASGGAQGTNSLVTINNVAPSITVSSVKLLNTGGESTLVLTVPEAETPNFKVTFDVTDANSCLNLATGNEIASAIINVRRSGIVAGSCLVTGDYDANQCYPDAKDTWNPSCTQTGSCGGAGDATIEWTCTFPLQYHADPTVADSKFPTEHWIADVKATDDDSANTGWVTGTDFTAEMGQFMAYDLNTTSIAYSTLDPGTDSVEQSTVLEATGNVGLDENLFGTDMTATGGTLVVGQQKYNLTAALGWVAGTALSGTAAEAELNLGKTIATGAPLTKSTYWVLRVPDPQATGTYTGTNTIEGKVGEVADW